jgi:hypothetical protein
MPEPLAYVWFVDGVKRAVHEDEHGQYLIDDDAEKVRGVWYVPREANLPIMKPDTPA